MTIVTKPITEQKKTQQPLVPNPNPAGAPDVPRVHKTRREYVAVKLAIPGGVPGPNGGPSDPNGGGGILLVRRRQNVPPQVGLLAQMCYSLAAILTLVFAVYVAMHVIKLVNGPHYYRGVCRLPYNKLMDDSLISGDFRTSDHSVGGYGTEDTPTMLLMAQPDRPRHVGAGGLKPMLTPMVTGEHMTLEEHFKADGSIEFDYELDLDFDEYESFEMPDFNHGKYLHDFKYNKTAIIDVDGNRCFVMPLNRDEIPKPRNLLDIIRKMKNGAYELDVDEIRHDTRVVLPPLDNLLGYGYFIASSCQDRLTYRLEPVPVEHNIFKRDVEAAVEAAEVARPHIPFAEWTGKKLVKYNIVNLADI